MKRYSKMLTTITRDRHSRDILIKKLELLKNQKHTLSFELESFFKKVQDEKHDVDKMEKVTLSSIVNAILQSKVEQLEKEKQKLYVVQLKYEKLKDEYNHIIHEIEVIKKSLLDYEMVEENYKNLIEEMTMKIKSEYPHEANEMKSLMEKRFQFERERILLVETLDEGCELLNELDEANNYLVKAKEWDKFGVTGGELVATLKKYHYLDETQELLHRIQWGLRKYHNALKHLGWHQEEEIASFLKVSDYWIEGVFKDYSIETAIDKLIDYITALTGDIRVIDSKLKSSVVSSNQKQVDIESSLESFFERLKI